MEKIVFIYSVLCLMTLHFHIAVCNVSQQNDQVLELPKLDEDSEDADDFENEQVTLPALTITTESKSNSDSGLRNGEVNGLNSDLNTHKKDERVAVNNTKPNSDNPHNNEEKEHLPQIFIDFENDEHSSKDNSSAARLVDNKDVRVTSSQPQTNDETTSSNNKGQTDMNSLLDQESKDNDEDNEDNDDGNDSDVKKKDKIGLLGHDDIDDEAYESTQWEQYDDEDDDDKDSEEEHDDDGTEDDYDESKNLNAENIGNDQEIKKSKPLAAPTSMVLFYTWMIVAVLIIIVGISTYQSRCKGARFPWTKPASNPKDDRKRLMEHEFV